MGYKKHLCAGLLWTKKQIRQGMLNKMNQRMHRPLLNISNFSNTSMCRIPANCNPLEWKEFVQPDLIHNNVLGRIFLLQIVESLFAFPTKAPH